MPRLWFMHQTAVQINDYNYLLISALLLPSIINIKKISSKHWSVARFCFACIYSCYAIILIKLICWSVFPLVLVLESHFDITHTPYICLE